MVTGREALKSIRNRVDEAKQHYDRLKSSIRELEAEHASALDEEQNVLASLAEAYLPELTHEALSNGLAQMKNHITQALLKQSQRKEDLRTDLNEHRNRRAETEADLEEQKARGGLG